MDKSPSCGPLRKFSPHPSSHFITLLSCLSPWPAECHLHGFHSSYHCPVRQVELRASGLSSPSELGHSSGLWISCLSEPMTLNSYTGPLSCSPFPKDPWLALYGTALASGASVVLVGSITCRWISSWLCSHDYFRGSYRFSYFYFYHLHHSS